MPRKTHIEVMGTIHEILSEIIAKSPSLRDKGSMFERLMQRWLNTDPRYAGKFTDVWLWHEFAFSGNRTRNKQLGIDATTDSKWCTNTSQLGLEACLSKICKFG